MWRSKNGRAPPPEGVPRDPHARRNAALREDAFVGRHASLVSAGTDKAGQPKLFGLWSTFPWHLQKESSLLALHFGSVGLFIILLLLLGLVSLWPLGASIAADEVKQNYDMLYQPALGAAFQVGAQDCIKPSEVSTFASKMSPGNFCNDRGNTSRFYCATECIVPYVRGVPYRGPFTNCLPPCSTFDTGTAPQSGECCVLQELAGEEEQQVPSAFLWLWCVVGTLIFCIWMLLLQYLQYGFAEAGNVKNINMSQYAVLLSNVGGVDCDDRSLKEFGRRYGAVVAAFHVRNFGRFLTPTLQLQRRLELVEELERIDEEQKPPPVLPGTAPIQLPGRFDSRISKLFLFVYKRILCLHRSTSSKKRVLQDSEDACRERIAARIREPDSSTGNAIIIFNSVASVANMMHEHNWRNRFGSMLFPPGWGRAFNIATRGLFARTPKIKLQRTRGNRVLDVHRHVSVRRAPEPSDIWWENTLYGGLRVVSRRVLAWSAYVLLLCFALAVQTVLAVLAKQERDDNKVRERPPQVPGEENAFFAEVRDTVDPWKFTIGKAIATMLFSGLGTVLCQFISDVELYLTSTQHTGSMVVKLTVFNLLNGFVVPTIAIAWSARDADSGGVQEDRGMRLWFAPGGLPDIALLVQLSNVVMPNFVALFRFMDMLAYHFLSRMACSKLYACNFLHPPAFRLNQRLPKAIYTLGLSVLYTPVLPISPLIGVVALIVQYAVDQYIALRHSSKPRSFQVEALAAVNYVVRLLPLVQIAVVWILFHEGVVNVSAPAAAGTAIWIGFAVMPALHTARRRHFKRWVEGGRPLLLQWAKKPGDKQPTWTHQRQQTCTMSVVPDVPDGIRFNYDTYLPDCVFLDPLIFTQHVKPHFYHHSPPLAQLSDAEATAQAPTRQIYQQVQPAVEVTQALQSLRTVQAPAAAAKTCSFRPQDLQEGPALPPDGHGGWWPLPRLLGRGSVVGRMAAGLGAIREADVDGDDDATASKAQSPTFMPPAACAFGSAEGGVSAVSATGRQVFVPGIAIGGSMHRPQSGMYVPDAAAGGQDQPARGEYQGTTPPLSLESK